MEDNHSQLCYPDNSKQISRGTSYYYDHKADIDAWFRQAAEEAGSLLKELEKQGKFIDLDQETI